MSKDGTQHSQSAYQSSRTIFSVHLQLKKQTSNIFFIMCAAVFQQITLEIAKLKAKTVFGAVC